jgi:hypothetical protein
MRVNDWQERLNAVVAKHQAMDGAWGASDCWTLTMDAVEAVQGERILPRLSRYTSEAGGYRLFARAGFKTVEEALESVLEPVPVLMAQRGDVGVIERDDVISSGVFTSAGFAVRTIYGRTDTDGVEKFDGSDVKFLPISTVKTAFKVR